MSTTCPTLAFEYQELFRILKELSFQKGLFTLASGKQAKYYLDCRKTTLSARGSYLVGKLLYEKLAPLHVDAVGGMSLGADPIVTAITYRSAEASNPIQGFLVRKEAKKHGTGNQIEGNLAPWMRIALVEDVVTTGGSTLKVIDAIEATYPSVKIVKVVALVDRQEGAADAFAKRSVPFEALYTAQAFLSE